MEVYRLHRAAHLTADYTGAFRAGGRWNAIGTPMLYAAEHLSLACIEVLVHVSKTQLPVDYVWSKAELPEKPRVLVIRLPDSATACQEIGSDWISNVQELAVRVP